MHACTLPHAPGLCSVLAAKGGLAHLTWQSRVETTGSPQAWRLLRTIPQASAGLPQSAGGDERASSLQRPAPYTFTCSALTFSILCCQFTRPMSPPPSSGSIQEIEPQAHNWKPVRFAGVNGILYTRCTN